jgi:serine/threonine-protein kinase HipA
MTTLDIWLEAFDLPIGRLDASDDGNLAFAYSSDYLAQVDAHPISLSLPLADETFDDHSSRAFFQNLLPENNLLDQVVARERLERGDIAGILFHVGADVSGALSCLPAGSGRIKAPGLLARDYAPIDETQLVNIVARLGNNQPLPDELRDPSPVSGYQRKVALTHLSDGRYAIPLPGTGAPTTHILKVPETAFPREAFYEANCASLADHVGLDAAPSRSFWIGGYEVILAQRYDRVIADGAVYRLHQEDFAQAMGLPPRLKYERDGRPGRRYDVATISAVLRQTESPAVAIDAFLRATIFNLAIGNTDNHAKNHALLYDRGAAPRLAPLYDLVPITLSEAHNHRLSFAIGEANYPDDVRVEDLAWLLDQFDLSGTGGRRFVEQRLIPIVSPLAQARDVKDGWAKKFDDELTARSQRLLDLLISLMKPVATVQATRSGT